MGRAHLASFFSISPLRLLGFLQSCRPPQISRKMKVATTMAERRQCTRLQRFPLFAVLLLFCFRPSSSSPDSDKASLLAFKAAADAGGALETWKSSDLSPCGTWVGISCSNSGRVTRIVLEGFSLSGDGDGLRSLAGLDKLRVLSLKSNLLSGEIPDLLSGSFPSLRLLFLSGNAISGEIPTSVASLTRLRRLDLSRNLLSGEIPVSSINNLAGLLTLRLDSNRLSGNIAGLSLPDLRDLNVSSNSLSGEVPPSLSSFPAAAFAGNPSLCGKPLAGCRFVVSDPAATVAAVPPRVQPADSAVVPSSPDANPPSPPDAGGRRRRPGISRAVVIAIVAGDFAAIAIASGLLFCYFRRKFAGGRRMKTHIQEDEKIVYSSSPYAATAIPVAGAVGGSERGKMVFVGPGKGFELEDLLRASAEMLGKGSYGTAYKAVLDGGAGVVAVKRLRDTAAAAAGDMEELGKLSHPNLVPLKAYYFAADEKLLVYEFIPSGSVFSLLHGNRGPGRTPFEWSARLRIAAGAARGLAYIHGIGRRRGSSATTKLAHGNVKSTNVLVDEAGEARLADFGLAMLSAPAPASSGGYRAPECRDDGRRRRRPWEATQSADVYAFGVVMMELLTGRSPEIGGAAADLPRWVNSVVREEWTAEVFDLELMRHEGIEEEMVVVLQVAMACTAAAPDRRPAISHVVRAIEEIRGGAGAGDEPCFDSSVSDESPSVSDNVRVAHRRRA